MKIKGKLNREWFENYWFYYRIHTIVGIFVLIVLTFSIVECVNKVTPDATVTYMGNAFFSQELISEIEDALSAHVDDVNNDGISKVLFVAINLPDEIQSEQDMAMRTRAELEIIAGETYLFLLDGKTLETFTAQDVFEDISEYAGEAEPLYGIDVSDNKMFESAGISGRSPVYAAVRVMTQGDEKKEQKMAAKQNALKLLEVLTQK